MDAKCTSQGLTPLDAVAFLPGLNPRPALRLGAWAILSSHIFKGEKQILRFAKADDKKIKSKNEAGPSPCSG